jgi:hypothetical protein
MTDVLRFRMGEEIPEWLLTVEPRTDVPVTARGNFRFAVDADVIDTDAGYVVVPRSAGNYSGVFDMTGIVGCKVFAPSKLVSVAIALQHYFLPEQTVEWVPMGQNGQIMQPPPAPVAHQSGTGPYGQQEPVLVPPARVVSDPRRSFWARLRYVFTGH